MAVCIQKFIVINNYGKIQFGDGATDTSTEASKSNSGATGPVIADFMNGKKISRTQSTSGNTGNMMQASETGTEQDTTTNSL